MLIAITPYSASFGKCGATSLKNQVQFFLFSRLISAHTSGKVFEFPSAMEMINKFNLYLDLVQVSFMVTNFRQWWNVFLVAWGST